MILHEENNMADQMNINNASYDELTNLPVQATGITDNSDRVSPS